MARPRDRQDAVAGMVAEQVADSVAKQLAEQLSEQLAEQLQLDNPATARTLAQRLVVRLALRLGEQLPRALEARVRRSSEAGRAVHVHEVQVEVAGEPMTHEDQSQMNPSSAAEAAQQRNAEQDVDNVP